MRGLQLSSKHTKPNLAVVRPAPTTTAALQADRDFATKTGKALQQSCTERKKFPLGGNQKNPQLRHWFRPDHASQAPAEREQQRQQQLQQLGLQLGLLFLLVQRFRFILRLRELC